MLVIVPTIVNADVLVPNPVGEPGFETVTDWTYAELDTNGELSGARVSNWKSEGTYSYDIFKTGLSNTVSGNYGQISRSVNFTGSYRITFDTLVVRQGESIACRVLIDSDVVDSYNSPYTAQTRTIITSNYSGVHTLVLQLYETASAAAAEPDCYFDNFIMYNNSAPTVPVITNPTNNSINYTTTTVNMTWNASTDEEGDTIGYTYQISNNSAFTDLMYYSNVSVLYSGSKTIPANQQMFFRVKANDTNRSSAWSSTVSIRDISLTAPSNGSTQNFNFPPLTDDVVFSWSATESGAIDFNLIVAEDPDFYQVVHDSTFNGLTKTVSLSEGTYYWKVRPYYTETSTYGSFVPAWNFNLVADYNPSGLTGMAGIVYSLVDGTQTPLSGATVYIRKETLNWSDSTVTGSNGYYLFDNLTNNSVYSIYAKAEGYEDSVTEYVTTIPGQRITKNILLNKCISGFNCFYNQHYVEFTVQNIWFTKYAGVTAAVYKGSELTASDIKTTGTDGLVNFLLIKDQQYRITLINTTQGISVTWTGYPSKTDYIIITDATSTSGWSTHGSDASTTTVIGVTTQTINDTHAFVNVSYNDTLAGTSNLRFYLNKTIPGDPNNQTVLQTIDGGNNDQYNASFLVSGYGGNSYLVKVKADHSTYGTISYSYTVQFAALPGPLANFDPTIILMLFVGFILFVAGMFGQTMGEQGSAILVGFVWILARIGVFSAANVGLNFYLGLTLASVIVIIMNINARGRIEGLQ